MHPPRLIGLDSLFQDREDGVVLIGRDQQIEAASLQHLHPFLLASRPAEDDYRQVRTQLLNLPYGGIP